MSDLVLMQSNYHGKYCIAELYRTTIVTPIIKKQGLDIDPDKILCLVDDNSTAPAQFCAKITLLPDIVADVIYQITGKRFELLLRLSQAYMRNLEASQIAYFIYDALRHIERDEEKDKYIFNRDHDIEVWREVLPYVGKEIPYLNEVKIYELGLGEGADYGTDK